MSNLWLKEITPPVNVKSTVLVFFFLFSPTSCDSSDGALAGRWFFVVVIAFVVFGTPRDVVETVRKLYLVTVVAFFATGSMMQLMMSVLVSISAFSYHV